MLQAQRKPPEVKAFAKGPQLPLHGAPRPVTFPNIESCELELPQEEDGPHLPNGSLQPFGFPVEEQWAHVELAQMELLKCNQESEYTSEGMLDGALEFHLPEDALPQLTQVSQSWRCTGGRRASRRSSTATTFSGSFEQLLQDLAVEHQRSLDKLREELQPTGLDATTPTLTPPARPFTPNNYNSDSRSQFTTQEFTTRITENRMSPFDFVSESEGEGEKEMCQQERIDYHFQWREQAMKRVFSDMASCNSSEALDTMTSIAILANSVLAGWIANDAVLAAVAGLPPDNIALVPHVLTATFSILFFFELIVRVRRDGLREFCFGKEKIWNWFDAVVVAIDLLVSALELLTSDGAGAASNFTVLRILRVLRITRAVRVLRLVRVFRELRMMVFSILHSGWSLIWSLVLLTMTMYAFAIYFVQAIAFSLPSLPADSKASRALQFYFGNIIRATYTLYLSISGGVDWMDIVEPLITLHIAHGAVFCLFTFFTTFALLNIITGIFVESSIASARSNQEEVTQDQLDATAVLVQEMQKMFEGADADRSGTISLSEFEQYLSSKQVRAYLNALGIETDKAKGLFQLLDLDGSGEITVEEFCFGCLRLKGNAKSIDLATLTTQTKRLGEQWKRFSMWTEAQFKALHDREARLEERLAP